jgi:hypothetical protein
MSTDTITIKPNNHRIYQCPAEKKVALLNELILQNKTANIVVVCSSDASALKEQIENKDIKILEDKDLVRDKELSCELLISYDIPIKAIVYMARVAKATQKAFLLLDKSEQNELYGIEMLLGRAIKQEVVTGYEYPVVTQEKSTKPTQKKMSKEDIKGEAKKRYEAKTQDAPKKEFKAKKNFKAGDDKWAKKKKAPNKFLGKDENGKAIFSGKDGERNHRYDGTPRGKYDAPKAGGRKISIKAIKPKESKES